MMHATSPLLFFLAALISIPTVFADTNLNATTAKTPWQPPPTTAYEIILNAPINPSSPFLKTVRAVDGDLFTNTKDGTDPTTIFGALHKQGLKIICYFSAGTYEPYRPDSKQYDKRDLGAQLPEWPDERWVNIRSERVRTIIRKRIELAAKMGCDAIDPDNMDGYANQNGGGFQPPLARQDSIDLIRLMSSHAASLGMSIGLKNALDIIPQVVDDVHFAINEECARYNECNRMKPFIDKGKPVFHIEYPKEAGTAKGVSTVDGRKKWCEAPGMKGGEGWNTLIKTYELDSWTQTCNGRVWKS